MGQLNDFDFPKNKNFSLETLVLIGELVTFHDLRRTRNFIGVPNKPTGSTGASDFPQRFLYPQEEVDANDNIPSPLPEFFDVTAAFTSY